VRSGVRVKGKRRREGVGKEQGGEGGREGRRGGQRGKGGKLR